MRKIVNICKFLEFGKYINVFFFIGCRMLIGRERYSMKNKICFTHREEQILECILEGLTNKEIANRLFISVHTVKAHLENLFLKTDTHSRVQLAVYILKYNNSMFL